MIDLIIGLSISIITMISTSFWNFYIKGYLVNKGEFQQVLEDHQKILAHLEESTLVVETVKDGINRQFLSNEKLWDIKKNAYDNIWKNILELEDLVGERLKLVDMYYEAFCNHGGWTGSHEFLSEEESERFYKLAEVDIGRQKSDYFKYRDDKYVTSQEKTEQQVKDTIERLVTNLRYNSIYLSSEIIDIIDFLEDTLKEQFKDNSFTYENSEEGTLQEYEWYEHIISEYKLFIKVLKTKKVEIIDLCKKDLHL